VGDFRQRLLDGVYDQFGVDAVYAAPGVPPVGVRLKLLQDSGEDSYAPQPGALSRMVADGVIVKLRAHDPGLDGSAPMRGGVFTLADDAPIRPGESFEILGRPMRLDSGRLEWTCQCSEGDPVIEEPDGG
jgi:hypothetical protein